VSLDETKFDALIITINVPGVSIIHSSHTDARGVGLSFVMNPACSSIINVIVMILVMMIVIEATVKFIPPQCIIASR
jgi:hypothetical protein